MRLKQSRLAETGDAGAELPEEQPTAQPAAHAIDRLWGAPPAPAPSSASGVLAADVRAALLQVERNGQMHRPAQNGLAGEPKLKHLPQMCPWQPSAACQCVGAKSP